MMREMDSSVTIRRYKSAGTSRSVLAATGTADCALQPFGKQMGEVTEGSYSMQFVAYFELGTDVKKGDRLARGDERYDVKSVVTREFGAFPFVEAILERTKGV